MREFDKIDQADLEKAVSLLEYPGWTAKLSDILGSPVEKLIDHLPLKGKRIIQRSTEAAIRKALELASQTMKHIHVRPARNWQHKLLVTTSGGIGGAFGLPALLVELPISTIVMMRSILDIARSEGEDIMDLESRLACIEVFALGGPTIKDNAADSGYFATRAILSKSVSEALEYITAHGLAEGSAPAMVRFIVRVASRFGVNVTEKAAAQAVPVIGAAGGAAINLLFINHFQDMARGHFIVRRLERKYGHEEVKSRYREILLVQKFSAA